jgi:hypothetical protein
VSVGGPSVALAELLAAIGDHAAGDDEVERAGSAAAPAWRAAGREIVVTEEGGRAVAFRLDRVVATAALRTPDAAASPRGPEWVRFAPGTLDRFALDRALAWFDLAVKRALEGPAGG